MAKHVVWAAALAFSIAAISKYTSAYSIEEEKQNGFMMKACVDAGGQWVKNFGSKAPWRLFYRSSADALFPTFQEANGWQRQTGDR